MAFRICANGSAGDLNRIHDASLELLHLLPLLLFHMVKAGKMKDAVGNEECVLPLLAVPVFFSLRDHAVSVDHDISEQQFAGIRIELIASFFIDLREISGRRVFMQRK